LHGDQETEAWADLSDAGQHRLVYDIDDNLWAYTQGTDHHEYWTPERIQQVESNISRAHLVTTPSPIIADIIRFKLGLNDNVAVLSNYVPAWVLRERRTKPIKFTVGYQGAPQKLHQSDLDEIQEELFIFLHKCDDARLVFYGQPRPLEGAGPFASRVDYVPWMPDVPAYYRSLHGITVGIGPLRPSPFTDAKSGIRAVEFAALGIPGVFSNSIPYRGVVEHRASGYLVSSKTDWRKYLIKLYRQPELVEKISRYARGLAMSWSTEANAYKWERAYKDSGPGVVSSIP
jgi:hypothetical protein